MIGDGMGFEQVKAASLYAYGQEKSLSFEKYYQGEMMTHPADSNSITDSAAAGTAMATGQKVRNQVISFKSGQPIPTVLELLQKQGKATGLITTKHLTDATPAAFAAHVKNRYGYINRIADDYLSRSRPNILFGAYLANGKGVTDAKASEAGYNVIKTRKQMQDMQFPPNQDSSQNVLLVGLFCPGAMPWEYDYYSPLKVMFPEDNKSSSLDYDILPHLSEMTEAALRALESDPDGLFLMVEGARIDSAGHDNIIEHNVFETLEFTRAFDVVLNWAKDNNDTLIIVTADHECGGLKVLKNRGKGFIPEVFWASKNHTGVNVPVYAAGQGAEEFVGVIDNTDIFNIIMKLTKK